MKGLGAKCPDAGADAEAGEEAASQTANASPWHWTAQ